MTSASNRRRAGAVDRLGWGGDAVGCWIARFAPTQDCAGQGGCYSAERLLQRDGAARRIIRRETTVLISVTRRVYLYEQRVSFHKLLRPYLIGAGRIPGMGTPSVSCTKPVKRYRNHPVFTQRHPETKERAKPSDL